MPGFDEWYNFYTIDGKELNNLFWNGKREDCWRWTDRFTNQVAGKFNIYRQPTQWTRLQWSEEADRLSFNIQHKWEKRARYLKMRGYRAQQNLEKMRYYYE